MLHHCEEFSAKIPIDPWHHLVQGMQTHSWGIVIVCTPYSTFAARYLPTFSEVQLEQYDQLINKPNNDWDIFHWVTGTVKTLALVNNTCTCTHQQTERIILAVEQKWVRHILLVGRFG